MAILCLVMILYVPDTAVVVMRKHHNKLRKTVYQEVIRAMSRLGLSKNKFVIHASPMEIRYKKNGNMIIFTGSDSIDDTKGIIAEDKKIRLVVLDELTEFFDKGEGEDEILNIIATFVRGNDEFFRMLYLFNPPKNPKAPIMEWVHKMEQRNDCIHVHTTYEDVPVEWLGQKLIDEALAMKKVDERMYNWVWLGKSIGLDEIIYYMFDEKKHIEEALKDRFEYIVVGCDYGQMNATTFEAFQVSLIDKRVQGCKEYYYSGRDKGKQKSPSDYANDFRKYVDELKKAYGNKLIYFYIDPSAKGLAEEIKRKCPDVVVKDAENSVELGINRVQKCLSFGILRLCPEQEMLKEEIEQYSYDKDSIDKGIERPVKEFDHAVDATRYAIMGRWKDIRIMLPVTERE